MMPSAHLSDSGETIAYLTDLQVVGQENYPFAPTEPPGKEPGKAKGPPDHLKTVRFRKTISEHGIFMHPPAPPKDGQPASLSYRLNGQYTQFQAQVSLNDGLGPSPLPITFSVYGDGQMLWRSNPVLTQEDTQAVGISIKGVDVLKIEVTCPPGHVFRAHAVWIEPSVSR
jgi:hypothetical protein